MLVSTRLVFVMPERFVPLNSHCNAGAGRPVAVTLNVTLLPNLPPRHLAVAP